MSGTARNALGLLAALILALMLAGSAGAQRSPLAAPEVAPAALDFTSGASVAGGRSLAALQRAAAAGEELLVLVELNVTTEVEPLLTPQARSLQRASIASAQAATLRRLPAGARLNHAFSTLPVLSMRVDAEALAALLSDPRVASVVEDVPLTLMLHESVPLVGAPTLVAQGLDGGGYAVAVLDTGVDTSHPFFSGKTVAEACFSNGPGFANATSLCPNGQAIQIGPGAGAACALAGSDCEHGTHVAGIAVGARYAGQPLGGFDGVGVGANLIAVQVFTGGSGGGVVGAYTVDILRGLEFVYSLRDTLNIAAVNLSLGGGELTSSACDTDTGGLKGAVDNLRAAGIATIAASGNNGSVTGISFPACISSVISVGATTKNDAVASFSNAAPILDMLAPGAAIVSAIRNASFASASGTSMAAPHVAGAWALMRQIGPNRSVSDILNELKSVGVTVRDTDMRPPRDFPRLDLRGVSLPGSTSVALTLTLGDTSACGALSSLTARSGEGLSACLTAQNTGTTALESHTFTLSVGGGSSLNQSLAPGATLSQVVPFTATASGPITASWSANTSSTTASTSATAQLTVVDVDHLRRPQLPIDQPAGSNLAQIDDLVITATGTLAALEVWIEIEHSWVGDLIVTLTHLESGVSLPLIGSLDGVMYCGGFNISAFFKSSAAKDPYLTCANDDGLRSGPYRSDGNLGAFSTLAGTWRMSVQDRFAAEDGGVWRSWGLRTTLASEAPPSDPTPALQLVPTSETCSVAGVGERCEVAVSLLGNSDPVAGFQADFSAPGFVAQGGRASGIAAACTLSSAAAGAFAVACTTPFAGEGAVYVLELERESAAASNISLSNAIVVRSGNTEEAAAGGSLAISELLCANLQYTLFPLGDVNGDGQVNVLDALRILNIAVGRTPAPSDFERYHADLNGSGGVNVADVLLALRKANNSNEPPQLSVAPSSLTLTEGQSACVLIGNAGSQPLPAVTLTLPAGVTAIEVTPSGAIGRAFSLTLESGSGGTVSVQAGAAGERIVDVQRAP